VTTITLYGKDEHHGSIAEPQFLHRQSSRDNYFSLNHSSKSMPADTTLSFDLLNAVIQHRFSCVYPSLMLKIEIRIAQNRDLTTLSTLPTVSVSIFFIPPGCRERIKKMQNTLKQILGKAAYRAIIDSEIRTTRSIVNKHNALAKACHESKSIKSKLRSLKALIAYDWHYTRKLTTSNYYRAYGRKFSIYDRVDFIHNRKSPYLGF